MKFDPRQLGQINFVNSSAIAAIYSTSSSFSQGLFESKATQPAPGRLQAAALGRTPGVFCAKGVRFRRRLQRVVRSARATATCDRMESEKLPTVEQPFPLTVTVNPVVPGGPRLGGGYSFASSSVYVARALGPSAQIGLTKSCFPDMLAANNHKRFNR
jgi:hypothetical protein